MSLPGVSLCFCGPPSPSWNDVWDESFGEPNPGMVSPGGDRLAHGGARRPRRARGAAAAPDVIRIFVSFTVSCPFCIDMNSRDFAGRGITDREILALRGQLSFDEVSTLSAAEKAALRDAESFAHPLAFPSDVMRGAWTIFGARDCAHCQHGRPGHFSARLVQALGAAGGILFAVRDPESRRIRNSKRQIVTLM